MSAVASPTTSLVSARPLVRLFTPDHHFLHGETLTVLVSPPDASKYEFTIRIGRDESVQASTINRLEFKTGLPVGEHEIRVRMTTESAQWSPWSVPLKIVVHPESEMNRMLAQRSWEHRVSLICERDSEGLLTLTDPWAFPPSSSRQNSDMPIVRGEWFRTPVYEGSTTLVNELPEYFENPLAYGLHAIDELRERGARFVTWHDMLDGRSTGPFNIILQLDVDAGRQSLARMLPHLIERNIVGTLMVHREAHDWYEYRVEDVPLELLKSAERAGWAIGYHCNAIGNVQRKHRMGDYNEDVLAQAADRFREDVRFLRQHFDVRTWTAHGGNVLNHRIVPPADVDIQCVDKGKCDAWSAIRSMFSDGGLESRPGPLMQTARSLKPGAHFFRIHPVKYGNYVCPWDLPPLDERDVAALGMPLTSELKSSIVVEINKQSSWLDLRDQHRISIRPSRMSSHKPLSRHFHHGEVDDRNIQRFRARRKPVFLREYPDASGDPRVFWWRLLRAFAPHHGEVLNVGALHPDSRDETTDFLNPDVRVIEMDIDESRSPHIVGDITAPQADLPNRFAGVLLFGLAYVHSPGLAVDACAAVVQSGGVGIFGFPDDSHPLRGSMWNSHGRPAWRRDLEPLGNIGLKGNLWCFQQEHLADLFRAWTDVRIENFSHYWFVVARRPA
ncbi:MAG TPA: hypothetical protein VG711_12045 [Phycisphaerales bacterium]|nr:hypothetical protein [Phycisphaerales bacterium]